MERLRALATWVLGDFKPDLTLLLDIPVQAGLDRIRSRETADRIEQEKIDKEYIHSVAVCYKGGHDIEPTILPNWLL